MLESLGADDDRFGTVAVSVACRLQRRSGMAMLVDGGTYHFRRWPDDGETFDFRAVGEHGEGALVNLTNTGEGNDYWVRADGAIRTVDGHAVFDVRDLDAGPAPDPMGTATLSLYRGAAPR